MPKPTDFLAFTTSWNGRARQLITDAGISTPVRPGDSFNIRRVRALWDTGATGSAITPKLAQELRIPPITKTRVTGVHGFRDQNTYLVNIHLLPAVNFTNFQVTELGGHTSGFDLLIGMDIVTHGDLAITNVGGKTLISFRVPSVEKIDYVEEAKRIQQRRSRPQYGRNDRVIIRNDDTEETKQVPYKVFQRKYESEGWILVGPAL